MIKPSIRQYKRPSHISEYPTGPAFEAGHLVSANSNSRTFRPIVDSSACIGCLSCFAACPDGTVCRNGKKIVFDYDFCKGCGICAAECKVHAITMVRERQ